MALVTLSPSTAPPCLGNNSVLVASRRTHQLQRHSPHTEHNHTRTNIRGQKSTKSCSTRFTTAENAAVTGGRGSKNIKAEYNLKKPQSARTYTWNRRVSQQNLKYLTLQEKNHLTYFISMQVFVQHSQQGRTLLCSHFRGHEVVIQQDLVAVHTGL